MLAHRDCALRTQYQEGKMKGLLRKAAAVLLVAVMAVAMFAGCTKSSGKKVNAGSDGSMFGILKSAMQLEKKTFDCDITADIEGTTAKIKLSGVSDGNATSLSAEVSTGGMSFKFDNAIVFTDDVIYFNVASIMDEVGAFTSAIPGADFDLEDLGITSDWVSFKAEGLFKQDNSIFEAISKDLDEAYADMITEKDGTYSITVSDKDSVKGFIDATKKLLDDKGDAWAKLFAEQSNKLDVEKLMNGVADDVVEAIVKAYEESTGEKLPEDKIKELRDSMLEETDMSGIEEINEDTYKEMFDEIRDQLDDASVTGLDGKIDVRTSSDKGVYTIKANAEPENEEDGSIILISTIKEDSSAKVEVPSDAQSAIDILVAIVVANMGGMN